MTPGIDTIYDVELPLILERMLVLPTNILWILVGIFATLFLLGFGYWWLSRETPLPTKKPEPIKELWPRERFLQYLDTLSIHDERFAERSWKAFLQLLEAYQYLERASSMTAFEVSAILEDRLPKEFSDYIGYLQYAQKNVISMESNHQSLKELLRDIAVQLESSHHS